MALLLAHWRPRTHAHVTDRRQKRMGRLRSVGSPSDDTSRTLLLLVLVHSLLARLDVQLLHRLLRLLHLLGKPAVTTFRASRWRLGRLAGASRTDPLALHLLVPVVLHQCSVLACLAPDLVELLLERLLLGSDAIQLARVRVVQLLVVLAQLSLPAVERFLLFPQFVHLRFVVRLM